MKDNTIKPKVLAANLGRCLDAMKLQDVLNRELLYNDNVSVAGIKMELAKKQPNIGMIIKELKDMIADRPNWNEISESTKQLIAKF